jgi:DNA-binding winged helix-turn-helix (wHTH) protein
MRGSGEGIRFGDFEVDLASGEIYRRGKRIPVQGQPFRVLTVLLERPGQTVTREFLRQALWPGDTFVDFEAGLNTAMRKLRGALADDPDQPRYIETLPRRGYRFIAPLQTSRNSSRSIDSLAVLPFAHEGEDSDIEYLSESITSALIDTLSNNPAFKRVIAHAACQYEGTQWDGKQFDPRELGRVLGVRGLLTGKLTLRAGYLSVTAELVDTSDLRHVWGRNYQRSFPGALRWQDDIASAISDELKLRLSPRLKRARSRHNAAGS